MIHELKTLEKYFDAVASGEKTFEVRDKDRPFVVGDYLALNEVVTEPIRHTGRCLMVKVTYILDDRAYCQKDKVILGIEPCAISNRSDSMRYMDDGMFKVPIYGAIQMRWNNG